MIAHAQKARLQKIADDAIQKYGELIKSGHAKLETFQQHDKTAEKKLQAELDSNFKSWTPDIARCKEIKTLLSRPVFKDVLTVCVGDKIVTLNKTQYEALSQLQRGN